jgi:hypothetical protein
MGAPSAIAADGDGEHNTVDRSRSLQAALR